MKEAIFETHPELRVMVPLKMNGYPAMHPMIGISVCEPNAIPPQCVEIHDDRLRQEARVVLECYFPDRQRSDHPHAILCLVWLQ